MHTDPNGNFPWLIFAIIAAAIIVTGGIVGGVSAGIDGGSALEIIQGIGKGMAVTAVAVGGVALTIGGFLVSGGVVSTLGSTMVTYGVTITSNMIEIAVVQGKKSFSEGNSFWEGTNKVVNAMFANTPKVLIGHMSLDNVYMYGHKVLSKITLLSKFNDLFLEQLSVYGFKTAFQNTAKGFWSSKNIGGLVVGGLLVGYNIYKLFESIFTAPDYEKSRWILY